MKTVTQNFIDAQNSNAVTYFYTVTMFRRYWNGSAYVWESVGTDLKPYLKEGGIGNINWQLDTEGLNVWRVSNVALALKNDIGQFNEGSGIFFNDTYQRYKTRIEVQIGYLLPDGTTETVYSFSGLIIADVSADLDTQTLTLTLTGKEIMLTLASAEDVSIAVTGESLGSGALVADLYTQNQNVLSVQNIYKNGVLMTLTTDYTISNLYQKYYGAKVHIVSPVLGDVITGDYTYGNSQKITGEQIGTIANNADFYTANKGVGVIDAVYVDGEVLDVIDYTVNNLNDKDNTAKITFPVGLGVGQAPTCDYHYWYQNIDISTLLGYLLDAAGFPSTDRTIGAIDVGSLLKYKIWDSKSDWDAIATVSRNASTGSKIGSVSVKNENFVLDIASNVNAVIFGSYPTQTAVVTSSPTFDWQYNADALPDASSPAWSTYSSGYSHIREINPAGILHVQLSVHPVYDAVEGYQISNVTAYLTYEIRLKLGFSLDSNMTFNCDAYLSIYYSGGSWYLNYHGVTYNTGITASTWPDYHIIRIIHNVAENKTNVYWDGACVVQYNGDGFSITGDGMYLYVIPGSHTTGTFDFWVDYVWHDSRELNKAIMISNVIDLGAATPNLGQIIRTWTDPGDGSTLTIQTQTSTTPDFSSGNDSWRTVSFAGNVGTIAASTVYKRYIRWQAVLYQALNTSPAVTVLYMPAHLYDVVDCGTNLDVYDAFTTLKQDNNGSVKLYSATSADNVSWDPEAEIVAVAIASTQRRYTAFRTVIWVTTTGASPEVQKEYFTYKITSLNVAMADFTGMTVQNAIEGFAQLLDYEIGVDTAGKYFFRKKNDSAVPVMTLSDSTNIISFDNDAGGWSRIYNRVKVTVGNFTKIISPIILGTAAPHSITRYGVLELAIASSNIKIDDTLDLASSLALKYYNRYCLPKRTVRPKCKMLPQVELSDTVTITVTSKPWAWVWGDSRACWGNPALFWYKKEMLPIYSLISGVVGIELDLNEWVTYITVREI
jgi:hypothetical protein